ncbi:MAG: ABC transporter substrate-binding protein [Deltaproteobacteria bacterium]|nr:ABC transporter substrate-binding protein [Deltaproteobacteria bacterium]
MRKRVFVLICLLPTVLLLTGSVGAQQKIYRIGVLVPGGPLYRAIDGLRDGLKEMGLEEGKQFRLSIRDTQGDVKAAREAARSFEQEKVNLIYALSTPVITAAKAATTNTPIVFCIGSDPVTGGLVESFAQPGGRLTGIHFLVRDLTAKRLEILKEILPKLNRVVTFYDAGDRVATEAAALARDEAKRLGIKFVERHVTSVDELRSGLQALKAGEVDAFFFSPDTRVVGQAQLIIDTAKAKKLPTMFQEQSLVAKGGLASYGQNYYEIGRRSAKYVQRVLSGVQPRDLKVETVDDVELAINLQTAKQIGLTIPPNVLARADKVVR